MIKRGKMTDAEYIVMLENEIKKRDKKIDKLEVEIECLKRDCHIYLEALILSKHKIFGKSSEHTKIEGQQSFFNEAETEYAEKVEEPIKKTVKGYTRRNPKTKRDELIKNIETEVITCIIPDEEQICPRCGSQMKVIGRKYVRDCTCISTFTCISVNSIMGDISKVCECSAAVPSGKRLGKARIRTFKNNNGKLGDTLQ